MAKPQPVKVTLQSTVNPSVHVTTKGKFVKLPSNVPLVLGEEITAQEDWILPSGHPDTKAPTPVKDEDAGQDAAKMAEAKAEPK